MYQTSILEVITGYCNNFFSRTISTGVSVNNLEYRGYRITDNSISSGGLTGARAFQYMRKRFAWHISYFKSKPSFKFQPWKRYNLLQQFIKTAY